MGYDLHITRKKYHFDEEGPVITPEEWLSIVENDPALTIDEENGPYHAVWSGPSKYPDAWIDYFEGCLFSKYPDEPLIDKMVQIAKLLDAKVQGDDGEIYLGGGQEPYHEDADEEETNEPSQESRRSWWQRLLKIRA